MISGEKIFDGFSEILRGFGVVLLDIDEALKLLFNVLVERTEALSNLLCDLIGRRALLR